MVDPIRIMFVVKILGNANIDDFAISFTVVSAGGGEESVETGMICFEEELKWVLAGANGGCGRDGFTSTASGSWGTVYGEMYPADFNGDGRTDFFIRKANGYWRIKLADAGGTDFTDGGSASWGTEYDIVYLGGREMAMDERFVYEEELKWDFAGTNGG